ncbi:short-chain dehydrogenase, partial [Pseudomonas aeruginosa]
GEVRALEAEIFNVGANVWFPNTETTERDYRKVWEMAAFGGFLTGREAARVMLPRQRGTINITGPTPTFRGPAHFAPLYPAK